MTLYVDASALVKRYVTERGSEAVTALMEDAAVVATSIVDATCFTTAALKNQLAATNQVAETISRMAPSKPARRK